MLLETDNLGAVDIANSSSVQGCTCHFDVHNVFLHELKDKGLLIIKYIPRDTNHASVVFNHHVPLYVGQEEYMKAPDRALSKEAASGQNSIELITGVVWHVLGCKTESRLKHD
jgi:hypothetical protein